MITLRLALNCKSKPKKREKTEIRSWIVGRIKNVRATDDEGNTIVHLLPLTKRADCKLVIRRFKTAKVNLIDFLFSAKNNKGECAFEAQTRFLKFHGVQLLLKLVATSTLDAFKRFLKRLEQWRPGCFEKIYLPRYGPLLLTRAKNFEIFLFLMEECKIDPNCRVLERSGHITTPLSSAILKGNDSQAAAYLFASNRNCANLWMNCRISSFEISSFWLKQSITSRDELLMFLKQAVAVRLKRTWVAYNGGDLLAEHWKLAEELLKSAFRTVKLEMHQLIHLTLTYSTDKRQVAGFLFLAALDELIRLRPDVNTPIDSLGRCLLDLIILEFNSITSKAATKALKSVDLSRILAVRKQDGTPYFAGCSFSTIRARDRALLKALPQLEKSLRFGLDACKTLAQINTGKVLGSAVECAICRAAFMQEEQLILLKCRHLFHGDCLYDAVTTRNESCCPYCRVQFR